MPAQNGGGSTIYVEGLNDFRKALKRVGPELPKALAAAHQRIGEIVAAEAERRAPKGPHQGGGRVRPISASIRALKQQRRVVVAAGGAATPHAGVYEFGGSIPRRGHGGTVRVHRKGGFTAQLGHRNVTHIPARPYLYPALAAKADAVVAAYAEQLGQLYRLAFPA